MNKAFEKILERLEEEILGKPTPHEYDNGIYKAIKIVREVAAEYNNGWIPCSEKLPEEATTYQVTEEVIINSRKQYVVDMRLFGTEGEWLCPSNRKIIAWQPLPEPYKPEGGVKHDRL